MTTELEKEIINQIEYYFGDINLPRDKFMQEKMKEDEGWITLDVLLTFKKLANLSTDPEVIANAVEKSDSHLVILSEDKKKLKRNPDMSVPGMNKDRERQKELSKRTAYTKGFPLDEQLNNMVTFLESYGPIESVACSANIESCCIIFKDIESCRKFVEAESIKYKDTELLREFQINYSEGKKEETPGIRKKGKKEKQEASSNKSAKPSLPKGATLHFSDLTENHSISREEIKEQLKKIDGTEIAFIDFNKGDIEGYILFAKENTAGKVFKKLNDGVLEVGETKLTFKVLEGNDEEAFLNKAANKLKRIPDMSVPEMTDDRKKELSERTAYAKGFPLDEQLNNIVTFLESYGPIESVTCSANVESCCIIFKDIDSCKKFVEAESIKYKDTELLREFQYN